MADSRAIQVQKAAANTPGVYGSATILSSNSARAGWSIQNQGTGVLYVLLGSGASTSVFHFTLKPCTANDDGTGGSVSQTDGVVYTGIITCAGSPIRYTALEL